MSSWNVFKLTDNPFFTTPPSSTYPIVWAGHKQLKKDIEDSIAISLLTSPSRIILCYGGWGSGKTHCMRYFTSDENLKQIQKEDAIGNIFPINLTLPRTNIFEILYINIIEKIGINVIRKEVLQRCNQFGELGLTDDKALEREFITITQDPRLTKVLLSLKKASQRKEEEKNKLLVEKYLLMTSKVAELDSMGIPRGVDNATDMLTVLQGIINLLTKSTETTNASYSRMILWIDETEFVMECAGKEMIAVQQFFRQILDYVPSNLLIFINMTLRPELKLADVTRYLGDAVRERTFRDIKMPALTTEHALAYIDDLLNNKTYRSTQDKSKLAASNKNFFPFDEASLKYLLTLIGEKQSMSPRRINDAISCLLQIVLSDGELSSEFSRGTKVISKDFIKKNEANILAIPSLREEKKTAKI